MAFTRIWKWKEGVGGYGSVTADTIINYNHTLNVLNVSPQSGSSLKVWDPYLDV